MTKKQNKNTTEQKCELNISLFKKSKKKLQIMPFRNSVKRLDLNLSNSQTTKNLISLEKIGIRRIS